MCSAFFSSALLCVSPKAESWCDWQTATDSLVRHTTLTGGHQDWNWAESNGGIQWGRGEADERTFSGRRSAREIKQDKKSEQKKKHLTWRKNNQINHKDCVSLNSCEFVNFFMSLPTRLIRVHILSRSSSDLFSVMNIDSKVRQGFRHLFDVQGEKHIVEFTELLNTFFVLLPDKVAKI